MQTTSSDQARQDRAVFLETDAGSWLKVHAKDGKKFYGVPSGSQPGAYHLTNTRQCSCPDHRFRQTDCQHMRAVRLHVARLRAQQTGGRAA